MYSRLPVPLAGSPTALLALDHAAALARLSDATVTLLHVIEPARPSSGLARPKIDIRDFPAGFAEAGQALLEEAANRLWLDGIRAETVLLQGRTDRVATHIVSTGLRSTAPIWSFQEPVGCCWAATLSRWCGVPPGFRQCSCASRTAVQTGRTQPHTHMMERGWSCTQAPLQPRKRLSSDALPYNKT